MSKVAYPETYMFVPGKLDLTKRVGTNSLGSATSCVSWALRLQNPNFKNPDDGVFIIRHRRVIESFIRYFAAEKFLTSTEGAAALHALAEIEDPDLLP